LESSLNGYISISIATDDGMNAGVLVFFI